MKCDKCGNPVTETDRICKNCGELNKHNPNNANLMSMMKHSTNARNNAFQSSIDKNTLRIREYNDNIHRVISEQIIKWYKLKDKKILSRLSVRQLKNLIKRCEEVIQDKESEML